MPSRNHHGCMTTTPEAPAKSLTQQVAEEIRVVLARRLMRQSELARTMGRGEQWLSVRLRGIQPIDLNDLAEIAQALGVSAGELLPRNQGHPNLRSGTRYEQPTPTRRRRDTPHPVSRPRRDTTRPTSPVPPNRRRPLPVRSTGRGITH